MKTQSTHGSPLGRRLRLRLNRVHAWVFACTGGRLLGRMGGHPVLLLTTTGRRSGVKRRTPLQYDMIDGQVLVVAADNGAPHTPAWWHNLRSDPQVTVRFDGRDRAAVAIPLTHSQRERVWPMLCARNHHLGPLQQRAGRDLAVVWLALANGGCIRQDRGPVPGGCASHTGTSRDSPTIRRAQSGHYRLHE